MAIRSTEALVLDAVMTRLQTGVTGLGAQTIIAVGETFYPPRRGVGQILCEVSKPTVIQRGHGGHAFCEAVTLRIALVMNTPNVEVADVHIPAKQLSERMNQLQKRLIGYDCGVDDDGDVVLNPPLFCIQGPGEFHVAEADKVFAQGMFATWTGQRWRNVTQFRDESND